MTNDPLHPRLIQANLALFEGDRIEARRLLDEYRRIQQSPADLLLWLEAHTESDPAARLEKLRELADSSDESSFYGRMARDYLAQEDAFARRLRTGPAPRWTRGRLLGLLLFVVLVGAGGLLLARPGRDIDALQATATSAPPPPTATPFPDTSQALSGDSYSVRYSAGILTVTAFEDRSGRILDPQSGLLLEPVPGARFYALQISFECRASICRQPPQAEIFLTLDNGDLIEVRAAAAVAGTEALQAIALGRTTSGWMVYEIPVLNRALALRIEPFPTGEVTEAALTIALPAQ